MFSYTLTLHINGQGELKPPITLKAPTPDYAYKVTYLGYFKNNPNGRFAADSTAEESIILDFEFLSSDIHVFPNPFANQVQINALVSITDVFVYDIAGSLVYSAKPNQTAHTIPTETFTDGMYLLVMKVYGKYYYKRIIKQE